MAQAQTFHHSDDADKYTSNAAFVYSDENTRDVLALLDPQPGDVILDVGCGTGVLTAKLSKIVADEAACKAAGRAPGRVIGIDVSTSMIDAAEKAHADLIARPAARLKFRHLDAHDLEARLQGHTLEGAFDKIFSNATLHWAKRDPAQVARGLATALKPGGRLVVEFGGHMNCIGVRSTLHAALRKRSIDPSTVDPWYFPTPKEYTSLLQANGPFDVKYAALVPRPTPLPKPRGITGWLETFAGPFINAIESPEERTALLREVEDAMRIDMYDEGDDQWTVMYVRLRVQAHKRADSK